MMYAPWDPLSGRFAWLASLKAMIRHDERSRSLGKNMVTDCPLTLRTALLALWTSATVAFLVLLATMQLSKAQSGRDWLTAQLIWPDVCFSLVISSGHNALVWSLPMLVVSISGKSSQYVFVERCMPSVDWLMRTPIYFMEHNSSLPTWNILRNLPITFSWNASDPP